MLYERVGGDSAIIGSRLSAHGDFAHFVCLSDVWDPYVKFLFTSVCNFKHKAEGFPIEL